MRTLTTILMLACACTALPRATTFQECVTALDDPCGDPVHSVHVCIPPGSAFVALCEFRATRGSTVKSFKSTGQSDACDGNQQLLSCCGELTAELRDFCHRANSEPTLQAVPEDLETSP